MTTEIEKPLTTEEKVEKLTKTVAAYFEGIQSRRVGRVSRFRYKVNQQDFESDLNDKADAQETNDKFDQIEERITTEEEEVDGRITDLEDAIADRALQSDLELARGETRELNDCLQKLAQNLTTQIRLVDELHTMTTNLVTKRLSEIEARLNRTWYDWFRSLFTSK